MNIGGKEKIQRYPEAEGGERVDVSPIYPIPSQSFVKNDIST